MTKTTHKVLLIVMFLLMFTASVPVWSHCQVPCGIYDDLTRIKLISEHIRTIEKAMKQIGLLSNKPKPNYNQIVRWVTNKEKHAQDLSRILTYYFMAQRIKPVDYKDGVKRQVYLKRLELLHNLLVYSMKAKQSIDLSIIGKLKTLLTEFKKNYLPEK